MKRDAVMGMHPQVRTRYIASIYAQRKGLIGAERDKYLKRQEDRAIARIHPGSHILYSVSKKAAVLCINQRKGPTK